MEGHPPAGWYPDPEDPGRQRYWNGAAWDDQDQTATTAALPGRADAATTAPLPERPDLPPDGPPGSPTWGAALAGGALGLLLGLALEAGGEDGAKDDHVAGHTPHGFLLAAGPGIEAARLPPRDVADVAPTIVSLLGHEPIGLDGTALLPRSGSFAARA